MTDKSYINLVSQSDEAIEKQIGRYLRKTRQDQRKTQAQVAKSADISRSTLSLLERGSSGNLTTLIKVLRVLGRLEVLSALQYQQTISPMVLAQAQHREVSRVRPMSTEKQSTEDPISRW